MNLENMELEFAGFEPDYEIRAFILSVAERLHLFGPSDAAIRMAVQNGKGAIKASCRIVSLAGTFFAAAVSDSPVEAIQQIEKKIRDQIDKWKIARFQNANGQQAT